MADGDAEHGTTQTGEQVAAAVTVRETSGAVRAYQLAFEGALVARLHVELDTADDGGGAPRSAARLHFDGDVRPEVMRAVTDRVTRELLAGLPRGVCVISRGHVVSSFDYGARSGR